MDKKSDHPAPSRFTGLVAVPGQGAGAHLPQGPRGEWERCFTFEELGAKSGDILSAVETGPGITESWWSIMPPYQPTSPDFTPFVMGISPAVWAE